MLINRILHQYKNGEPEHQKIIKCTVAELNSHLIYDLVVIAIPLEKGGLFNDFVVCLYFFKLYFNPDITLYIEINYRWITNLNINVKTIVLQKIHNLGIGKVSLNRVPKMLTVKSIKKKSFLYLPTQ